MCTRGQKSLKSQLWGSAFIYMFTLWLSEWMTEWTVRWTEGRWTYLLARLNHVNVNFNFEKRHLFSGSSKQKSRSFIQMK